jgi:hypothetical protein
MLLNRFLSALTVFCEFINNNNTFDYKEKDTSIILTANNCSIAEGKLVPVTDIISTATSLNLHFIITHLLIRNVIIILPCGTGFLHVSDIKSVDYDDDL